MKKIIAAAALMMSSTVFADTISGAVEIQNFLEGKFPHVKLENVGKSGVNGLYEVRMMDGSHILIDRDKKHIIMTGQAGDIAVMDIETERNLTAERDAPINKAIMAEMTNLVTFPAKNQKAEIIVFTDVNCPYCRMFHNEVPALNKAGVTVKYAALPFQGNSTEAMQAIWCADDKAAKLAEFKALPQGERTAEAGVAECADVIAKHKDVGIRLGAKGTPAMMFETGELLASYMKAEQIVEILGLNKEEQK
ncbi:DsbC family protein [Neptuniibacter sp. QD37_11]|uniref:DsbC family protein n=1 Tax=Neptuniibacter sp. QD37_11 TaxID=3398209 RepID=UPI0039F508A6